MNEYYTSVSFRDWDIQDIIDIDQSDIKCLSKYGFDILEFHQDFPISIIPKLYLYKLDLYTSIQILKSNDEWYYVDYYFRGTYFYYKCDQLDGLIKLLDKISLPKSIIINMEIRDLFMIKK